MKQFSELKLPEFILNILDERGYKEPTPIQSETIPFLLEGADVLGQAQTGTGKTAAFALPLLANLNLKQKLPQVLVLAPTRELAIQVADSFRAYGKALKNFSVVDICGGQSYTIQLKALKKQAHVIVGTPGRIMDHMRRGTLVLDQIEALVLDEADEMLRMGFIDDVKWILEQTPETRQTALFSATMPKPIREIARKHLVEPHEVTIKQKTATVEAIEQSHLFVRPGDKFEVLTRLLEVEQPTASIIFVRTKAESSNVAEKLSHKGYRATALNGDISQKIREQTIQQFKNEKIKILVATDVAARGLDIEHVSHVFNYDAPHDSETYVHRIGRTGRAGRAGKAIIFLSQRERHVLRSLERATRSKIAPIELPTNEQINQGRKDQFKSKITQSLDSRLIEEFKEVVREYQQDNDCAPEELMAALALMANDSKSLLLKKPIKIPDIQHKQERNFAQDRKSKRKGAKKYSEDWSFSDRSDSQLQYRIEVGRNHGVKPGQIVGAIANETGINGRNIGQIKINKDHSTVSLPGNLPKHLMHTMQKIWVCGRQLKISEL